MGFLIPDFNMSVAELKALKAEVKANLLARAAQQTGRPMSEFVVRDIFPKDDFSFNGCEWQNQTAITVADTWTKDWSKELPKSKFAGLYGVIHHAVAVKPNAGAAEGYVYSGVKYQLGAAGNTVKEQVHLQSMGRNFYLTSGITKVPVGLHKPLYYDGSDTIYASLISNATISQYAEELELLGMVCEPWGEVISGDNERAPGNDSLFIPEDELTLEDIRALRDRVKATLIAMAAKETGKAATEFVVRDIFPKDDFGFNGVEWQNQTAIGTADTWTKDWSKELPKTQFVGFFGFDQASAVAGIAGFPYEGAKYGLGSSGATTLKAVHTQKALKHLLTSVGSNKSLRGYHEPVYYKGTDTIYLSLIAKATTTQYYNGVMSIGLICEPYGSVIS